MYGYVFISTNSSTDMKYIGINKAVKFDSKFIGDTDAVLKDADTSDFSVAMLMPYEDEKSLELGLKFFLDKYEALTDPSFYNCEKPKKSRKKKVEDE